MWWTRGRLALLGGALGGSVALLAAACAGGTAGLVSSGEIVAELPLNAPSAVGDLSQEAPGSSVAAPEPVLATTVPPSSTAPATTAPATTAAAPSVPPTVAPTATTAAPTPLNLYRETTVGKLSRSVADIPSRVYVPNSEENTVSVIDPATFQVIDKFRTDAMPHHVTPSWDMQTLYVLNTAGNTLLPVDARTSKPGAPIPVTDPYNLYFTPDGTTAIVVAERYQRLDLRDPRTWALVGSIPVPHAGVDHGDFSPDGRYFYASCEFSGFVVTVDLVERRLVAEAKVGSQPIDVKLAPDASVLYVADQGRGGVIVLDPASLAEVGFIPTGRGAHGLYPSRDTTQLYVTNRLGGSVSVIDFAARGVVVTWPIPGGGSPDMGGVSADGLQLWVTGRYGGEVYVIDTRNGTLIQRIKTGAGAHGLALFPQPGRYSMGHTGVYR